MFKRKTHFIVKKSVKYKSTNDDLNIAVILSSTYLKAQGIYGQFSCLNNFSQNFVFLILQTTGKDLLRHFYLRK